MQSLNLIELIQQGWLATYPLIICSVLMVAILGERIFAFSGIAASTRKLTSLVVPPLTRGEGLVVAIIAVIAYNYLQVRVAAINAELRINHSKFVQAYKQGRTGNGD